MLILLFCGLPGVGKTSLANELAPLINAVVLSTDKIRKKLISNPTYTKEEKELIYDVIRLRRYILYFLMCYKAWVRVKVSLFSAKDLERTSNSDYERKRTDQAEDEARRHLRLAESYLDLL